MTVNSLKNVLLRNANKTFNNSALWVLLYRFYHYVYECHVNMVQLSIAVTISQSPMFILVGPLPVFIVMIEPLPAVKPTLSRQSSSEVMWKQGVSLRSESQPSCVMMASHTPAYHLSHVSPIIMPQNGPINETR